MKTFEDYVMDHAQEYDFSIDDLGVGTIQNTLVGQQFVDDSAKVIICSNAQKVTKAVLDGITIPSFQKAGPREKLFHDPSWSRAAIVTCGGLSPGLNDVIKGLVETLWFEYGVQNIFGIPYGYKGLNPENKLAPIILNPDVVDTIHESGGTILGSSRGAQPIGVMVDTLQRLNINMLFTIGGDGTLRGAHEIAEEIKRRRMPVSVIGVPKTIDNDLQFTDRTFGFETAVSATHEIITSAHMEAKGAYDGIALVKLMGRDSGFIAAHASLANSVVNFCLIPELEFTLEGENGLLQALDKRFSCGKTHAVIVVAEGAGQHLFNGVQERKDASGNILKNDIGELLKNSIHNHFAQKDREISIKYFDPSYYIRSVPSRGSDAIFCAQLSQMAVHAAMAGKTDMVVGHWFDEFTHVPIEMATKDRRRLDTEGSLWKAVLGATRQNIWFGLHSASKSFGSGRC
jgi:6-phosphofructokinase 1